MALELLKTRREKLEERVRKSVPAFGVKFYAEDAARGFAGSMVCPCGCEEYSIKFRVGVENQGLYGECLGCGELFKLAERPV
jgi:hypothetical protein